MQVEHTGVPVVRVPTVPGSEYLCVRLLSGKLFCLPPEAAQMRHPNTLGACAISQ
jgi:hypothetical protein